MLYAPAPMHVPDGFLAVVISLVLWAVVIVVVAYALLRVSRDMGERQVPLMGVVAAAIFAGQMLNFAVAGGSSGHLMGAAIAAILLGPWPAIVVMTSVVSVQALIFQDGGLLALGANIFNMGIIGVAVSYAVYSTVRRLAGDRRWGIFTGGFLAAWLSIVVAALAVALELAFSGTSPANLAIPAMGAIHALIGIGEGLITVGALAFINTTRPDLLGAGKTRTTGGWAVLATGLVIALALAIAAPLASANPDGLEWVAEQQGFLEAAQAPSFNIIPNYLLPGFSNQALATIAAGVLGVLLVLGMVLLVGYTRRRRDSGGE